MRASTFSFFFPTFFTKGFLFPPHMIYGKRPKHFGDPFLATSGCSSRGRVCFPFFALLRGRIKSWSPWSFSPNLFPPFFKEAGRQILEIYSLRNCETTAPFTPLFFPPGCIEPRTKSPNPPPPPVADAVAPARVRGCNPNSSHSRELLMQNFFLRPIALSPPPLSPIPQVFSVFSAFLCGVDPLS